MTLLELIKKNKEAFSFSVLDRMHTSMYNKERHQDMLDALLENDYKSVALLIKDSYYAKPLNGVIVCSKIPYEDKCAMMDLLGWD